MPALKNPRHEAFARNLVEITKKGGTRGRAYSASGYRCENGAAEAAASRMLADVKNGVANRVRELMQGGAKRAEVTVASLLGELEEARIGATSVEQFAAATSAVIAKAKLSGLMIDKVAVGSPSEFAACEDIDSLLQVLLKDQTAAQALEQLEWMRGEIMRYASDHAVVPAEPDRFRVNETEAALALFRPKHRH